MAQRILALEVSADRVQAALAVRLWNSYQLIGVFEQERSGSETDVAPALRRLLERTGRPDVAISALPGNLVTQRLLELPFGDRRRLDKVVPFALEEHLPFSVENAVVAFVRVGRDGDNTLVMAAFARKELLREHLALLARAGLDPKIVTLSSLALAGLFARARNGRPGAAHLLLDIERSTSLVLLDAAGTPRVVRTLTAGLERRDSPALNPSAAGEIVAGIRQILLAHAAEVDQPEVVVVGAAAISTRVRGQLAEALALPVRSAAEFDHGGMIEGSRPETVRAASCVAMLMGEAPTRALELLNFRQGDLSAHRRAGDLAPFYLPMALVAAIVIIALVNFGLGLSAGYHRLHLLDAKVQAAAAPAIGQVPAARARETLEQGIRAMEQRLKLMGGNIAGDSPLDTLAALSRALPPRMPVEMKDLVIDDNGLKLTGTADSFATIGRVKNDLEASNYFTEVKIEHAKAGSAAGKVDFQLSAGFAGIGSEVRDGSH